MQGLREVVVHARRQTAFPVTHQRVGRERNDVFGWFVRAVRIGLALPDQPRRFIAVHVRHLTIEQENVVRHVLDRLQNLPAIGNGIGAVSQFLQLSQGHLLVHFVVFGEQDADILGQRNRAHRATASPGRFGRLFAARLRERVDQAVTQARLFHRLDEAGRDAIDLHRLGFQPMTERGQQNEARRPNGLVRVDRLRQRHAVHVRQVQIEHHKIVRGSVRLGGAHPLQRGFAAVGQISHHFPAQQLVLQYLAGRGLLIDDQHAPAGQPLNGELPGQVLLPGGPGKGQMKPERRTLARLALHAHFPVHQLDQLFGDRQSQAGAAVFARRRSVGLGERLENLRHRPRVDADARVADGEAQRGLGVRFLDLGHTQHDFALLGELHRVAQEVGQHLPEPAGIAAQKIRHLLVDPAGEFDLLFLRRVRQHLDGALDGFAQFEVDVFQHQFAGLDLGEIQDFADDSQQGVGAVADGLRVFALLLGESGVQQQPRHAGDGVHRRADFVAHVRQELGLGAGRFQCRLARPFPFLVGQLAGGDVLHAALVVQ